MHDTKKIDRKKANLTLPHNSNMFISKELALTPYTSPLVSATIACLIRSQALQREVTSKDMTNVLLSLQQKDSQYQEECSIVYLNNLIQKANLSKTKSSITKDLIDYLGDLENLTEMQ